LHSAPSDTLIVQPMLWHIVTPEYPPGCGGVGDYTALVAAALASEGDAVHVWHPGRGSAAAASEARAGVITHLLPDPFGRRSRAMLDRAFGETPGTVLVQYVPNAFGLRGVNLPFCRWLLRLRNSGADVRVMFHEPFFYFGAERPWRNALALAQRAMASLMLRASATVYLSTDAWLRYLSVYGDVADAHTLAVPATIAVDPAASLVDEWKQRIASDAALVVGHFGTFGDHVSRELRDVLPHIFARRPHARVLLVGDGSRAFADRIRALTGARDVVATGRLPADAAAAALRACDVLIAPYRDGVTTRRTSVMAALTTGRPVVTTDGPLTEPVWRATNAVLMVPSGDAPALADAVDRVAGDRAFAALAGARCRRLYDERFALRHTVAALRGAALVAAST
jgi:glycosyltransferase involved in cell wall biosynthesis